MSEVKQQPKPVSRFPAWLWPVLLTALALAVRLLYAAHPMMDSDQAVIGLMAMHILDGEFPIFFWGAPYSSPVESYLAAPVFALLGPSRNALCLTIILESMVFLWLAYLSAKDMWNRSAGLWAMAFAALPTWYFLYINCFPRTSYLEICTVALALVWVAWRLVHRRGGPLLCLVYGVVAGLAFWFHTSLAVFAIAPTGLYLLMGLGLRLWWRPLALMAAGFLAGSLPVWIYNLQNNWQTFTHMASAKPGAGALEVITSLFGKALPNILGVFHDGTVEPVLGWLAYVLLALALAGLVWLIWLRRRSLAAMARLDLSRCDGSELWLLYFAVVLALLLFYGETPHSTRRHYAPLLAGMIPLAGYLLSRLQGSMPKLALFLAALALFSNAHGLVAGSRILHPEMDQQYERIMKRNQDLFAQLEARDLKHGYCTDYWDAFLLTFDAGERLTFGVVDDPTYPPYVQAADGARRSFILTRSPLLNGIKNALAAMGATSEQFQVRGLIGLYNYAGPPQGFTPLDLSSARASASKNSAKAGRAMDGAISRWSPGDPQAPGQQLVLDLGQEVQGVCLLRLLAGLPNDSPRRLRLEVSSDAKQWQTVLKPQQVWGEWHWSGPRPRLRHLHPIQDIYFPPMPVRYMRLTQESMDKRWFWSVQELSIYTAAGAQEPKAHVAEVLARAQELGAKVIYGDELLAASLPARMRPEHQTLRGLRRIWSLANARFLPADPQEAVVAVRQRQGRLVRDFLQKRGLAHKMELMGGYVLFSGIARPEGYKLVFTGERLMSTEPNEGR